MALNGHGIGSYSTKAIYTQVKASPFLGWLEVGTLSAKLTHINRKWYMCLCRT